MVYSMIAHSCKFNFFLLIVEMMFKIFDDIGNLFPIFFYCSTFDLVCNCLPKAKFKSHHQSVEEEPNTQYYKAIWVPNTVFISKQFVFILIRSAMIGMFIKCCVWVV